MSYDLKKLQLMLDAPPSFADDDLVTVIVQLAEGQAEAPAYLTVRTVISSAIFTAEVLGRDIPKLAQDVAVKTYELGKPLQVIG